MKVPVHAGRLFASSSAAPSSEVTRASCPHA
jgi:hypothetical protein